MRIVAVVELTVTIEPGSSRRSSANGPSTWCQLTWAAITVAPGSPGLDPKRYQPTAVSSGISSWPSACTPTGTIGAAMPSASIVMRTGVGRATAGTNAAERGAPTEAASGDVGSVVEVGAGCVDRGDSGSAVVDGRTAEPGVAGDR